MLRFVLRHMLNGTSAPAQNWDKYRDVFLSKSHAALYLHAALEIHKNSGLSFFWLFSSVAVFGSIAQVKLYPVRIVSCRDRAARTSRANSTHDHNRRTSTGNATY